jgi:hypothetical protein
MASPVPAARPLSGEDIKATPQAIWDALTKAEWTVKYGYAPLVDYELRAGGKFRA